MEEKDYLKAEPSVNDVYAFLDAFEKGVGFSKEENECLLTVEEKLRDIKFAKYVDKLIFDARRSSKPISLETYRKAIKNANIVQGANESYADYFANRAIEYSVKKSEKLFCFYKIFLK